MLGDILPRSLPSKFISECPNWINNFSNPWDFNIAWTSPDITVSMSLSNRVVPTVTNTCFSDMILIKQHQVSTGEHGRQFFPQVDVYE